MADITTDASITAGNRPNISPSQTREPSASHSTPRIRRRNRAIASCLECRRRKLKCDKSAPCTNCTKFKRDCLYLAPSLDPASQQKLAELKDKMGNLESSLEHDVVRRTSNNHERPPYLKIEESSEIEDVLEPDDEKDLEPTPLASLDQVYEDDADDDLMDLGVQLGKMRVSDRIGGFARPKMAQELSSYPERGVPSNSTNSSPRTMPGSNYASPDNWSFSDDPAAWLGPGPDYIAPASSFFFPSPQTRSSLNEYLPSRSVCDKLIDQYWSAVHTIATIVHKPSFERQYASFWDHVRMGTEPPASMQAVIFAAMFSAAVSMPEYLVIQYYSVPKVSLIERLQSSVEITLARANFLRTTKLETMQALVMYLIPLCRAEISRSHSALTGTAIRLAECMGLHRDGSHYGFSAVEIHVRRLIWYQLCFLDMRTCEATGPNRQIRKDEFDTKLPLNVNEVDLMRTPAPTEDSQNFTDITLSKIRFECTEMHRMIWVDMPRVDQKKLKLAAVLGKIQRFKTDMEARYMPMLQGGEPRQLLALHVYRILTTRLYITLLHRYLTSPVNPMPERLRKILLEACLTTNEFTISLDTRPELASWAWYRGAILQYHSAMLLMMEVYHHPTTPEAPRIWRCLDYVFDLPPHLTGEQKCDMVISTLRDRLHVYQSMRKMKGSKTLEKQYERLREKWRNQEPRPSTEQIWTSPIPVPPPETETSGMSHMDPQQFSMPPLRTSMSDTGTAQNSFQFAAIGDSVPDVQMQGQGLGEIDWNEWDQYFPSDTPLSTEFGVADLKDFNLGFINHYTGSATNTQQWGGETRY